MYKAIRFTLIGLMLPLASQAAMPGGEPVAETPTLHSLGCYWVISGDDNANATVALQYRAAGEQQWKGGMELFRVEKDKHRPEKHKPALDLAAGQVLFAGSIVLLHPDTAYQVKLTLNDPDGPAPLVKTLEMRTRAEPQLKPGRVFKRVVPGDGGGGTGTPEDPFKGLAAAIAAAKPGDGFLLAAGTYDGPFTIKTRATAHDPVVFRGEDRDKVILRTKGEKGSRVITANDSRHVWLEALTIRDAEYGVLAHDATGLVVRDCRIAGVTYGIAATRDQRNAVDGFFIADNVIEGPSTWPRTKGIESARGVQVTGSGHVVCYNRITGFADAIDTYPSGRVDSIDFHNNDVRDMTDDGIELDYSIRNVRCFHNRLTNVFQGISVQPVHGGPVYVFRNAIYNIEMEPFKIHNGPSGALFFHNTTVKRGTPLLVSTPEEASRIVTRNNLFVGTNASYAFECQPPMKDCDLDHDGFAGGPYGQFLKWNGRRYATADDVRRKAPVYKNVSAFPNVGLFESGVTPPRDPKERQDVPDLRPAKQSPAVDAGVELPGINDGFEGKAPDLGAYESTAPLPHYGPRTRQK